MFAKSCSAVLVSAYSVTLGYVLFFDVVPNFLSCPIRDSACLGFIEHFAQLIHGLSLLLIASHEIAEEFALIIVLPELYPVLNPSTHFIGHRNRLSDHH
jgi:hypothetical protein